MVAIHPVVYSKAALSYSDQLTLLEQRGLIVTDRPSAIDTLSRISYYRLSAYWYPYRLKDDNYSVQNQLQPGTTFEDILCLYEFDRNLRLFILDALERVEVSIRTAVTYHLGMAHGAFAHEEKSKFYPKFDHKAWVNNLRDETLRSSDAFVAHYKTRYSGFPTMPVWMMAELISLGSLSRLYKGMQNADKRAIAAPLNIHHKRLQDWLHVLTYVRNVCAHHSRLWNRELAIKPMAMSEPEWNNPLLPRSDKVFCVLLMLRYLTRQTESSTNWRDQCNEALAPIVAKPAWRESMGISANWATHPNWL
jgi:abortive infection bacteriophage resistance protein